MALRPGRDPGWELTPLPKPDLGLLGPQVREKVLERRAFLDGMLEERGASAPELGEALGEMGKLYLACDLREAAEACFSNAERLAPQDPRWPYFLGHLYRSSGNSEKAISGYERALLLRAGDVASLIWLARLHHEQGRSEIAESLFLGALELNGSSASALFGLGRIALERDDPRTAVERLEAALEISPEASMIHYPLAMAYRALGEPETAELHLRQWGTAEPYPFDPLLDELEMLLPDPALLTERGMTAYEAGNWAEAARQFRKAVAVAPENPEVRLNLGTALARLGDREEAMEQFEQVLRRSPGDARALLNIGSLLAAAGSSGEAIRYYTDAITSDPALKEAHLNLADELQRTGRYAKALPHYEVAIDLAPLDFAASLGQALTLIRLERFTEARDLLDAAMEARPEEKTFALLMARLLATCPDDTVRDGTRALELAQGLLERDPTVEVIQTTAMALAELGQFRKATRWQQRAIAGAQEAGQKESARLMSRQLDLYRRGRPCREFWLDPAPARPLRESVVRELPAPP